MRLDQVRSESLQVPRNLQRSGLEQQVGGVLVLQPAPVPAGPRPSSIGPRHEHLTDWMVRRLVYFHELDAGCDLGSTAGYCSDGVMGLVSALLQNAPVHWIGKVLHDLLL